nr:12069_t:CDS:2 [Entrophospora candida]
MDIINNNNNKGYLHCNVCFAYSGPLCEDNEKEEIRFWLTECGHVICHKCIKTNKINVDSNKGVDAEKFKGEGSKSKKVNDGDDNNNKECNNDAIVSNNNAGKDGNSTNAKVKDKSFSIATTAETICLVCNAKCVVVECNDNLPDELITYFKPVHEIIDFQQTNTASLVNFLKDKLVKQNKMLDKAKNELLNCKNLKRDFNHLIDDNKRLKRQLHELKELQHERNSKKQDRPSTKSIPRSSNQTYPPPSTPNPPARLSLPTTNNPPGILSTNNYQQQQPNFQNRQNHRQQEQFPHRHDYDYDYYDHQNDHYEQSTSSYNYVGEQNPEEHCISWINTNIRNYDDNNVDVAANELPNRSSSLAEQTYPPPRSYQESVQSNKNTVNDYFPRQSRNQTFGRPKTSTVRMTWNEMQASNSNDKDGIGRVTTKSSIPPPTITRQPLMRPATQSRPYMESRNAARPYPLNSNHSNIFRSSHSTLIPPQMRQNQEQQHTQAPPPPPRTPVIRNRNAFPGFRNRHNC